MIDQEWPAAAAAARLAAMDTGQGMQLAMQGDSKVLSCGPLRRVQAHKMGTYAAHCMFNASVPPEAAILTGMDFELFTHATRFCGKKASPLLPQLPRLLRGVALLWVWGENFSYY